MARRMSNETKLKKGYGQGRGSDYKAQITTTEFNSDGTTCLLIDWHYKRPVQLMSQIEKRVWYLLKWNNNVLEIREQFPLDINITMKIAEKYGIRHPSSQGKPVIMTTDFLVTLKDGRDIAVYVKANKDDWKKNKRSIEKTFLEKMYWKHKNVEFIMVSNEDINPIAAINIELISEYFDINNVFDEASMLKHRIANKEIEVDINKPIDFKSLLKKYGGEENV